jgi:hypothetical protein
MNNGYYHHNQATTVVIDTSKPDTHKHKNNIHEKKSSHYHVKPGINASSSRSTDTKTKVPHASSGNIHKKTHKTVDKKVSHATCKKPTHQHSVDKKPTSSSQHKHVDVKHASTHKDKSTPLKKSSHAKQKVSPDKYNQPVSEKKSQSVSSSLSAHKDTQKKTSSPQTHKAKKAPEAQSVKKTEKKQKNNNVTKSTNSTHIKKTDKHASKSTDLKKEAEKKQVISHKKEKPQKNVKVSDHTRVSDAKSTPAYKENRSHQDVKDVHKGHVINDRHDTQDDHKKDSPEVSASDSDNTENFHSFFLDNQNIRDDVSAKGVSDELLRGYAESIKSQVYKNWKHPEGFQEYDYPIVSCFVSSRGKATQFKIIESSGNKSLDQSLKVALYRSQFDPELYNKWIYINCRILKHK